MSFEARAGLELTTPVSVSWVVGILGLHCRSHIIFTSFCHHFPGVPVRPGRQEKEIEVIHIEDKSETICRGQNTSCRKCPDLHEKKYWNKWIQPHCRTGELLQCILVWVYCTFIFILLKVLFNFTCEFSCDSVVTYKCVCCSIPVCIWISQRWLITWQGHHKSSSVLWRTVHTLLF